MKTAAAILAVGFTTALFANDGKWANLPDGVRLTGRDGRLSYANHGPGPTSGQAGLRPFGRLRPFTRRTRAEP